ncbi:MAG: NAD(P)H-dependent oxidoreductase subunit E, partial [Acidimicrobiia bacterium]
MSDLRFRGENPSPVEAAALDRLLNGTVPGPEARHLLLPALHAIHDVTGWISPGGLDEVCRRLGVAPAEAHGVASFYGLFSMEPRPTRVVHVCVDLACRMVGAGELSEGLSGGPDAVVEESPCLGLCERAPAALVVDYGQARHEAVLAPATRNTVTAAVDGGAAAAPDEPEVAACVPQRGDPSLVLLRRVGVVDPTDLDDYRAHGGYAALRQAMALGPAGVIREVTDSKLVGRGGAAFPAGRKWAAVAAQTVRPLHLVCNADESEPGTFK